jgi:hypothetical protein
MKEPMPFRKETVNIFENNSVKNFIALRDIQEEDLVFLEKINEYPKDFISEFHNLFTLLEGRSIKRLKEYINSEENREKKDFLTLLLQFSEKYGWEAGGHLIIVLRKLK